MDVGGGGDGGILTRLRGLSIEARYRTRENERLPQQEKRSDVYSTSSRERNQKKENKNPIERPNQRCIKFSLS